VPVLLLTRGGKKSGRQFRRSARGTTGTARETVGGAGQRLPAHDYQEREREVEATLTMIGHGLGRVAQDDVSHLKLGHPYYPREIHLRRLNASRFGPLSRLGVLHALDLGWGSRWKCTDVGV